MILELLFLLNITFCIIVLVALYIIPAVCIYMMPIMKFRSFAKKKAGTRRLVINMFADGLLTTDGQHIVVANNLARRILELPGYSTSEIQLLKLFDSAACNESRILNLVRLYEETAINNPFFCTLFDNAEKKTTTSSIKDDVNPKFIDCLTDSLFDIMWGIKRKTLIGKVY